ncbi:glutaminase [Parvularcula sp. IMCC14364]|uniref:glutaminase n=1 Tax=Parvularcula sp. IMCC14364 TaxID=3067902 RepID=UPI002740DAB7|nr:glutaminase [Parvularcula sp. IMCC14364]
MKWQKILNEIRQEIQPELGNGKVANYIPALSEADPKAFGMAVVTTDGEIFTAGNATEPFSIQSISKVLTLTLALGFENENLFERVGREPSGSAFNSIVQLEQEGGIPRNPFINAGAIVVTDTIITHCNRQSGADLILDLARKLSCSGRVRVDDEVARSEALWGNRNRSLAYFMKSFGVLKNDPEEVLQAYFCQCALEMTCTELARAGLYLANDGVDPVSGEQVATHAHVNRINALMMTCGHYDMSGDFAFHVGLPGKSGVGGGILAIVPGVCAVAVWSPALNKAGNSLAGTLALELFSEKTSLNLF